MNKFKKFLIPVVAIGLLLTTLIGCGQPLGEIFDPSGNPFGHRFSDMKDIRTATFVVAASDSEHKYDVDFRCDGIDDQVQIQAAIDALPVGGGEVELLDGTFVETISTKLNKANVKLSGQGPSTIIKVANGISSLMTADAGVAPNKDVVVASVAGYLVGQTVWVGDDLANEINTIESIAGSTLTMVNGLANAYTVAQNGRVFTAINAIEISELGCVIENLSIDGNDINQTCVGIVHDNKVQAGVQVFTGGDGAKIRNLTVYNNPVNEINIQGDDCEVTGCEVYQRAGHPTINNGGIELSIANRCRISNNYVHDVGGDGIDIDYSNDCIISHNHCVANKYKQIESDRGMRNIIIENVCLDSVHFSGITIGSGAEDFLIMGNYCQGNALNGIKVIGHIGYHHQRHSIIGNICRLNAYNGIHLTSYADDCLIANNQVTDNGDTYHGIVLDNHCLNNLIVGNKCGNTLGTAQQEYGIYIADNTCVDNVVRDNDLRGNDTGAIFDSGTNTKMHRQHSDTFEDVLASSANLIVNAQNFVNGAIALTGVDPKYPRGLVFAITAGVTEYTLTVVGTNGKGQTITEVFTFAVDGLAWSSDNAFDHVTSITLADRAGAAATIDVGIDGRLGLMNVIYETGDVWKITKNLAKQVVAGAQVDVDYDTYDMAAAIGIAVNDDFVIWYRSNLNIIS